MSCCRCNQKISIHQEVFDTEECFHNCCTKCRFRDDLDCLFCKPENKIGTLQSNISNDNGSPFNEKDFLKNTKRKIVKIEHIVPVDSDKGAKKQFCTVCKRVFKSSNARYHYTCASGDKPLWCNECGQKFVKRSHLDAHMNSHYGIKPYKCTVIKCKAAFFQKDKLVRHLKTHTKEKKFECPVCNKQYTSQPILHTHILKLHASGNNKPYQCELCPRTYKYLKSLRIHMLKHKGSREYMCELCGKKYVLLAQLKLHRRSHISYQRRRHKCACGRRFTSRKGKERHELTHNTTLDFECSLCNTTFGRKDNLERHMKNFHKDDTPCFNKSGKLTAVVAPFSKNTMTPVLNENCDRKESSKQKLISNNEKDKGSKSKCTNTKNEVENFELIKEKSYTEEGLCNTEDSSTEKSICDKQQKQNLMHSVIIQADKFESQVRPSVIKTLPKLLPYRILPPDKRFLKLTEEIGSGNDSSDLMPPPLLTPGNTSKRSPAKGKKTNLSEGNALNRCFRIICHTNDFEINQNLSRNVASSSALVCDCDLNVVPADATVPIDFSSGVKLSDKNKEENIVPISSAITGFTIDKETNNFVSIVSPVNLAQSLENSSTSLSYPGGPTLPTSLPEVNESIPEENFTNSYSLSESSYPSYTPYFDSDCFQPGDGASYEDFDMSLQYINEPFRVSK